jgi:hypothetical protein
MRKLWIGVFVITCFLSQSSANASVGSIVRELRRMTGYVVVGSDSVSDVYERSGTKYVRMLSGVTFRINGLILGPLVLTDVIIFAKPMSDELKRQFPALPPESFYSIRLLIDDEFVDASRAR